MISIIAFWLFIIHISFIPNKHFDFSFSWYCTQSNFEIRQRLCDSKNGIARKSFLHLVVKNCAVLSEQMQNVGNLGLVIQKRTAHFGPYDVVLKSATRWRTLKVVSELFLVKKPFWIIFLNRIFRNPLRGSVYMLCSKNSNANISDAGWWDDPCFRCCTFLSRA